MTIHLLDGILNSERSGLTTRAYAKAQSLETPGIKLNDMDVFRVPVVRGHPDGIFIPGANGYAQLMVGMNDLGEAIFADGAADSTNQTVVNATRTDTAFLNDVMYDAANFSTEMAYQHLIFEALARRIQPNVDVFVVRPDPQINPAIFTETEMPFGALPDTIFSFFFEASD